jgi:hypothetical protein
VNLFDALARLLRIDVDIPPKKKRPVDSNVDRARGEVETR